MVATVGSISIDLVTNVAKFAAGFRSAATTVDRESARMTRSIQSADRSAQAFLRNSVAGLAAGLGTREIARYADAWTEAGNKIRAAGEIAGREGRSIQELNDIATKTRSGLTETVDLYSKLLLATSKVAKSEEEVARATEIVNKAFKAGGQSAQTQAAGILQLGQALSSGVLQGDELRSLRENAPVLLKAIADEFGVTIGQLKKLGAEGALTSDRVFKAILKGQKNIDDAFAQTKATLGDNIEILKNAAIELVGVVDQITGGSAALSGFLASLAEELRNAGEAAQEFSESGALDDLLRVFGLELEQGGALDSVRNFFNEVRAEAGESTEEIKAKITELEQKMLELEELGTEIDLFAKDRIAEDIEFLKAKLEELGAAAQASLGAAVLATENARRSALQSIAGISPSSGADGNLPNVSRYGQDTAENTKRTADAVEEQTSAQKNYFTDLEETLRNDVTGSITKYIQQLIYAQTLAAQTISEAVRTSFLTGESTAGTGGKTYTSTYRPDIVQTRFDPEKHLESGTLAYEALNRKGLKVNYAGMFAEGGSFVAGGNQTGDSTRLLMDVNAGEKVTVSPAGSERPIILNYHAAPGETERTARQNARHMAETLSRETARA